VRIPREGWGLKGGFEERKRESKGEEWIGRESGSQRSACFNGDVTEKGGQGEGKRRRVVEDVDAGERDRETERQRERETDRQTDRDTLVFCFLFIPLYYLFSVGLFLYIFSSRMDKKP
jgi:hypothetical protein